MKTASRSNEKTRQTVLDQLYQEDSYRRASKNHQKRLKEVYEQMPLNDLEYVYFSVFKESVIVTK